MKTSGLDQRLPPHQVLPGRVLTLVPRGEAEGAVIPGFEPGDFLLSRAHGHRHTLIRFGQRLRLRAGDRCFADYTHAALVVSADGKVIEAIGAGVRETSLTDYVANNEVYQVVRITASQECRENVVKFANAALTARAPYAFLAIACTTLWAFTGSRLTFFMDGSFTCSGLVAQALERTGAMFGMNAARVMPAQLAVFFHAPPPPVDPPVRPRSAGLRRLLSPLARR